jgi:hypothetical protein
MTRNTDQWYSLQGIWPFRRETVQKFLDGLHFEYLGQTAQAIRQSPSGDGPGSGVKVLTDHFTAGREHVVFELEFSDGTFWVARISLPPLPVGADDCSLLPGPGPEVMHSEIVTMRYMWPRKPPFRFLVYTVMNFKALTPSGPHTHLWTELWESLYGRYHQLLWTTSPTFTAKWQRSS